jgi:hypothetical protein
MTQHSEHLGVNLLTLKLQSIVNTVPGAIYTTLQFLCNL